jgi:hypothetical protein
MGVFRFIINHDTIKLLYTVILLYNVTFTLKKSSQKAGRNMKGKERHSPIVKK